jgi:hypothetical protein
VQTDQRYYDLPKHEHGCFSEILNVSVNSEDSSQLHSFVSSELQMRGITIWARVVAVDNDEAIYGGTRYEVLLTRQSNSLNRTKACIFWDENLPSSEADPERWDRLQAARSSDLLLMFVIGTFWWAKLEPSLEGIDGLVLREQLLPKGENIFVRLGKSEYGTEVLDMLTTKLDLQPDVELVDEINLDDPRLADLVHEVTII